MGNRIHGNTSFEPLTTFPMRSVAIWADEQVGQKVKKVKR